MTGILLNFSEKYIDKFLEKTNRKSENECWEWLGGHSSSGYGVYGNPPRYAHRISYVLFYGKLPDGFFVCHTCDNPSCVNPHHLFRGTHSDNMRDRNSKGRSNIPHGECSSNSKLKYVDIMDIRVAYKEGIFNQYQLAYLYDVHVMTINHIIHRKSWKYAK